ncbi:hypothetical protein BN77_1937 [Rhizobium mesoamericanum STM3625]|uniref:Uncharacterized protein n=1 Tax=Rhizobium mesoamericanum STM3625 TaxID=1211777 RepID=K0PUI6_9HYPH|nr:hypothetical protein BN77_1937 [Rhizobium mesoamericanum STM3625]
MRQRRRGSSNPDGPSRHFSIMSRIKPNLVEIIKARLIYLLALFRRLAKSILRDLGY